MAAITGGAIALGLATGSSPVAASGDAPRDVPALSKNRAAEPASGLVRDRGANPARQTFLLKLDPAPTARVFDRTRSEGLGAARAAARAQLKRIGGVQDEVAEDLPSRARVLYETHSVISAVAVQGSAGIAGALEDIPGVTAVYPVAPKRRANAYAMNFQGAPAAWSIPGGDAGAGQKIAVVDSGIDYTHSDFGGPGSTSVFATAQAGEGAPADPGLYPNEKVIGGHDFVGDTYQPNPDADNYQPQAIPDENPLDCGGHGSHVAGSAAGYGVNADGTPYAGAYGPSTDFDAMKIGPGMAPKAELLAYKVFGCTGQTSWIAAAIDMAADPDDNGDPSDGADVINLSVGSDFGSVEDGDGVAANAAVDHGISVVAAAGNASDRTDISGSPGDASRVISVANSQDARSIIDGTEVEIDDGSENYGSSRASEYDWANEPDLSGPVVLPPTGNQDGCAAFPPNTFTSDQVVILKWSDDNLECGSIQRSNNLVAAGAGGFIFGSNSETFSADIYGSAVIPGVLMVKSAAEEIRAAITANSEVEVLGTSRNSVNQEFPGDNDKVSQSTSRGIHAAGNVKPDVSAVGTSVFSADVGTGSEGTNSSGTSMASPMVAGLAALVQAAHPGWSPLQVKADIMNTATHDITVNGGLGPASDIFTPVRVGAGRVDAAQALTNEVLAYNAERGAVSVSFGPVEVDGPTTLTKEITVENTGSSPVSYDASYEPITEVPGVEYSVSPAAVTVAAGTSQTLTVTLSAPDPAELTKAVDPTVGRASVALELPRETLAEASGRVLLEPADSGPVLRVPVYAAPRPAAVMGQAEELELSGSGVQTANLELTGNDLGQDGSNGTGDTDPSDDIVSIAAGFELTAKSGQAPQCTQPGASRCVNLAGDRAADLKHVGFTSDSPSAAPADALGYFALSTHAPASIPTERVHFQVEINLDADADAELFIFNNRLVQDNDQAEDVFVSQLYDPALPAGERTVDLQPMNARLGDLDTALYDTDTLVLPFSLAELAEYGINPNNPRIDYGVAAFSEATGKLIDLVGFDGTTGAPELSANLFDPAVTVTDESPADYPELPSPLVGDHSGNGLTVTRDLESYRGDDGQGLMMVHFHNKIGNKSQITALKSTVPGPDPLGAGPKITASVSSSKGKTRGWYRTPVKVSFACTAGEAPLAGSCPAPVEFANDGRDQAVTRSVTATDGQSASAQVGDIDIDRTRPAVKIKGVRKGKRYRRAPKGRCVASDRLSKVASCRLRKKRKGKKVTYIARAADRAGNTRILKVRIRIRR